ncbi:MAG: C40 family peptidase [Noviherbaspirillum sp.]
MKDKTTSLIAGSARLWRRPVLALAFALACPAAFSAEPGAADPLGAMARLHKFTDQASEMAFREVAMRAMALVGIHYKYGGDSPEHGLDCSGLVRYVFKEAWGTHLPRTSREISKVGEKVSRDELQPGDLVFFNTLRRTFSHVGIYLGDNKFIHSPTSGSSVRVESMDLAYWKKRFNGARRVSQPEQ